MDDEEGEIKVRWSASKLCRFENRLQIIKKNLNQNKNVTQEN